MVKCNYIEKELQNTDAYEEQRVVIISVGIVLVEDCVDHVVSGPHCDDDHH
jgi:hypothetical protein